LLRLLARELECARRYVAEGAMASADHHITIALRLYEASPNGTIPPQVGNVIVWAGRAAARREWDVALMALDKGLRILAEDAE
jgi:hypothetical protein